MEDDFSRVTGAFVEWFQTRRTTLSPNVELADLRRAGKGRGLVASRDLSEDEELFSISRNDLLSVSNSDFHTHDEAEQALSGLDDEWLGLTLVMIYEHMRGTSSPWYPYLAVLPSTFDTPIFWSSAELSELQASAVVGKIGKANSDTLFRENLIPAIRWLSKLFPAASSLSDDELLDLAHQVGSAIMAYAFDIERQPLTLTQDEEGYVSDEELDYLPKAMVPMADMLNADADLNNARLFYEEDRVVMRTIKPVEAGAELFNDYGSLPRADLLRRYGYVTDNYAKYDVVEVSTDLVVEVVKASSGSDMSTRLTTSHVEAVIETLSRRGFYEDAYDVSLHAHTEDVEQEGDDLSPDDYPLFPAGLQMLLHHLLIPMGSAQKPATKPSAICVENMKSVYAAWKAVLSRRLSEYATRVEDDKVLLQSAPMLSKRHVMAVHVRLGEKNVLEAAIDFARKQLDDLNAAVEHGSGNTRKHAMDESTTRTEWPQESHDESARSRKRQKA